MGLVLTCCMVFSLAAWCIVQPLFWNFWTGNWHNLALANGHTSFVSLKSSCFYTFSGRNKVTPISMITVANLVNQFR